MLHEVDMPTQCKRKEERKKEKAKPTSAALACEFG
jgi:hypothetical protein